MILQLYPASTHPLPGAVNFYTQTVDSVCGRMGSGQILFSIPMAIVLATRMCVWCVCTLKVLAVTST